ncbi:MAG: helix-turn-helix domain-containing protein [Chloroflexota bacterium]
MTHREFAPDPILRRDIRSFWMIEETPEEFNRDPVVPDSYTELVISVGAPIILAEMNGVRTELPRIFFTQIQKDPINLKAQGDAQFLAVSFYPWTAHALFDLPDPENQDMIIMLDGQWQRLAQSIAEAVQHSGYEEGLARLQQFMIDAYCRTLPDITPVRSAGEQLYASKGQFDMDQLAQDSCLSLRQLERRFKQLTGVTPKSLARLIRFEATRNRLFYDPTMSILDLVHEFGYTDQAHLTHEFKAFMRKTPGQFVRHMLNYPRTIEVGFLQYA